MDWDSSGGNRGVGFPYFPIPYFLLPQGPFCLSSIPHPLYFTDVTSSRDLPDFKCLKSKELPRCEIPSINPPAEGKIGGWFCEPTGILVEDEQ